MLFFRSFRLGLTRKEHIFELGSFTFLRVRLNEVMRELGESESSGIRLKARALEVFSPLYVIGPSERAVEFIAGCYL